MISNKEKRLSQAFAGDVYANSGQLDGPPPPPLPPMLNHHHHHHFSQHHPLPHHPPPPSNHLIAPYGLIGSAANRNHNNSTGTGSNGSGSATRTALDQHHQLLMMGKKPNAHHPHLLNNERNSHSLSHDFSAMYISNQMGPKSKTQVKSRGGVNGTSGGGGGTLPALPSLEEMNSAKRDAAEAKKQMMQMEKVSFY